MAKPFTTYKLIILFMLRHSRKELSGSQISEFILDREYTGYFHLQQAISELEEAELVEKKTIQNMSYYRLTQDGENTLSYFQEELSPAIRQEILDYLNETGQENVRRILTPADLYTTSQGSTAVRCQIVEQNVTLLDISLIAPSEEAARVMCRNWSEKSQAVYEKIMEELL